MKRQHLGIFFGGLFAGLLAAGLVLLFLEQPRQHPIKLLPPPTPAPLRVHVTGAVLEPDVYQLPPGSILEDGLLAAGGNLPQADLTRINLASVLEDGQHVYIPFIKEDQSPNSPADPPVVPHPDQLNINLAGVAELEMLPGIGPSLAQKILEYRTQNGLFLEIDDLLKVSGIGPSKLEQIRDLIRLQ